MGLRSHRDAQTKQPELQKSSGPRCSAPGRAMQGTGQPGLSVRGEGWISVRTHLFWGMFWECSIRAKPWQLPQLPKPSKCCMVRPKKWPYIFQKLLKSVKKISTRQLWKGTDSVTIKGSRLSPLRKSLPPSHLAPGPGASVRLHRPEEGSVASSAV